MAKAKSRKSDMAPGENSQDIEISDDFTVVAEPPRQTDEGESLSSPEPEIAKAQPMADFDESDQTAEPVAKAGPEAGGQKARGAGFFPLMAGGVVAALLGAGATVFALPRLPETLRQALVPASSTQTNLENLISEQASQLATLQEQLAQMQSAPAKADTPEMLARIEGLQEALSQNQASLDALSGRVETLAFSAGADSLGPLQQQIEALQADMARLAAAPSPTQAQLEAANSEAQARIAEAEAQAAQLRADAEAEAKQARIQAALARLRADFAAGLPLQASMAEAALAGVSMPEGFPDAPPSLAALQESFPEAARQALALARKETAGEGIAERMGSFLLAQTGARSLTPRDGNDPDAVLSRAQAAVERGEIAVALQELAALSAAAQGPLQPWAEQANARLMAEQALDKISQSAN